jgi:hypothetical protein
MGDTGKARKTRNKSTQEQEEPKGQRKLDELGVEWLCDEILSQKSMRQISDEIGVLQSLLVKWIAADRERSARVRESRKQTAQLWEEMATKVIADASDAFELAKAKELAHHYRWRASKIAPAEYGDKVQIGGASDLPPIQSNVTVDPGEAYKLLLAGRKDE